LAWRSSIRFSAVSILGLFLAVAPVLAQDSKRLTAEDMLEIRHLLDSYAQTLDRCTNSGRDYADFFAMTALSACHRNGVAVKKSGLADAKS
jgi:hypothetical protein